MKLAQVPNALCVVRLIMIPVLWVLALRWPEARILFVVLLALAFLTDFVDGILCRKYKLSTPFGAKFDRISDDLLTLNTAAWLYVLRPELFRDYWPALLGMLLLFAISVGLQYRRFGRKIPFHLYVGKASIWVIGVFAVYTFLFGTAGWFVYLVTAVVGYALLEEILIVCMREDVDEHVTSWLARRQKGDGVDT